MRKMSIVGIHKRFREENRKEILRKMKSKK